MLPSLPNAPSRPVVALVAGTLVACTGPTTPDSGTDLLRVTGHGPVPDRATSDLWVASGHAYTGTHGCRTRCGDRLLVWDVTGEDPVLVDSVVVDARTLNDVKVEPARALAVLTHEGSEDGRNGVTLLDVADPGRPRVLARYTDGLETGVHNVWIDGSHLYVAVDPAGHDHGSSTSAGGELQILDVSDPTSPRKVGDWYAGTSLVHDVYVRDGLAFVSHWDAGLVILDVGGGSAGGSPGSPVEISRIRLDGQVHNAWYWPDGDKVFVGEEDFAAPGQVHVVDVEALDAPRRVATYRVGRTHPPHNFWLDERREVLWIAYYGEGVRAVDVSGELAGELHDQGREIGRRRYADGSTYSFGIQRVGGRIYVSDFNTGLWILDPAGIRR